ncbi:MAG: DUF3800 domain-containing protein [Solirubrobacteraceae bacterium]
MPYVAPISRLESLPANHPTSWVFLDETGVAHAHSTDRFFGIGVLKLADPSNLLHEIQLLRARYGFHGELHWANFDKALIRGRDDVVQFAKDSMDLVLRDKQAFFCCHIADRQHGDLTARFRDHPHAGERAYEALAAKILAEAIEGEEIVSVIADRRSTSSKVSFERDVSRTVNQAKQRLAVANVCCLDSRSTDALQVVDLLLGAAAFDLRQGRTNSGSQKQQLLAHLLDRCECSTFRPTGREDPAGKWKVELLTQSRKTRRKHRGR